MREKKRNIIQALAAFFSNPYLPNLFTGEIYKGETKQLCVPGLNCYSCPAAAGACPIGSLQAVIGGRGKNLSLYVTGIILFFGAVFGRLICGFLCPFGFLQDLLYKIPSPKPRVPRQLDRKLRFIKYLCLAGVVLLPAVLIDPFGIGTPFFCKYICPAGTLEGGIPLVLADKGLRSAVGLLFSWKMAVLIFMLIASVLLYRPFCKYICPLGAIYGLLNRISVYQMHVEDKACTHCMRCERTCKMGVEVIHNINSAECIRCGACKDACPTHAIASGFVRKKRSL